jgi:hypothetical protein
MGRRHAARPQGTLTHTPIVCRLRFGHFCCPLTPPFLPPVRTVPFPRVIAP